VKRLGILTACLLAALVIIGTVNCLPAHAQTNNASAHAKSSCVPASACSAPAPADDATTPTPAPDSAVLGLGTASKIHSATTPPPTPAAQTATMPPPTPSVAPTPTSIGGVRLGETVKELEHAIYAYDGALSSAYHEILLTCTHPFGASFAAGLAGRNSNDLAQATGASCAQYSVVSKTGNGVLTCSTDSLHVCSVVDGEVEFKDGQIWRISHILPTEYQTAVANATAVYGSPSRTVQGTGEAASAVSTVWDSTGRRYLISNVINPETMQRFTVITVVTLKAAQ